MTGTDTFVREVSEEVRRDEAARLWRRYGALFIGLIVLAVIGAGAWRWTQVRGESAAAATGERYDAALALARAGKTEEAGRALDALAGERPYGPLARLRAAAERAPGDPAGALKAYDEIARDGALDPTLRDLAGLRAGAIVVDGGTLQEVESRLSGLAAPGSGLRSAARELIAVAALKAGDAERAGRQLDTVVSDPDAPPGSRQRAELLLGLVRGAAPAAAPAPKP